MVQDATPSTTDTQVGAVTKDPGGGRDFPKATRSMTPPAPFMGKKKEK